MSKPLLIALLAVAAAGGAYLVLAPAPGQHQNLEVLPQVGEALGQGMRQLGKGIGVECEHCHVKDEWASDAKPQKGLTRAFFRAVLAEPDAAKRKVAIDAWVAAIGAELQDEGLVWGAFAHWKAPSSR